MSNTEPFLDFSEVIVITVEGDMWIKAFPEGGLLPQGSRLGSLMPRGEIQVFENPLESEVLCIIAFKKSQLPLLVHFLGMVMHFGEGGLMLQKEFLRLQDHLGNGMRENGGEEDPYLMK